MSNAKNHRNSILYKDYPDLVDRILALENGQRIYIECEDEGEARNFRQRLYSFLNPFYAGNSPLTISLRSNAISIEKRAIKTLKVSVGAGAKEKE